MIMRSNVTELTLKFSAAAVALNLYASGVAVADDVIVDESLDNSALMDDGDSFVPMHPFSDFNQVQPIEPSMGVAMRLAAQDVVRSVAPEDVVYTTLKTTNVTGLYFEDISGNGEPEIEKKEKEFEFTNDVPIPVFRDVEKVKPEDIKRKISPKAGFNGCHNGYSYNDFFADIVNDDEGVQTTVTAMIDGAAREFFPFAFGGKEVIPVPPKTKDPKEKKRNAKIRQEAKKRVVQLQLLLMRMGGYKTFERHHDGDLGATTRGTIKRCQQQLKDTYTNIQVDGRATATFLEALAYEGAKTLIYTAHFIRQEADRLDLDQKDSLLFLNHESRGPGDFGLNPFITSGSGPIGVGQVAPSTYGGQIRGGEFHHGEAQKMGIHKTIIPRSQAKRELTDIETNVKVSLFYIKGMMKKFRFKSVLKGWASGYNLGPGAAGCIFNKCSSRNSAELAKAKRLNGLAGKSNSSVIPANVKKLKKSYNVNQVNRLLHYTTGLYIATNTHTKLLGGGLHGYNTKKALTRAP